MVWQLLYVIDLKYTYMALCKCIQVTYCCCEFPLLLQVTLPIAIIPRYRHTAVAFGIGSRFRVVVLFGGANTSHDSISETTLLLLGECAMSATNLSTQTLCCDIPHSRYITGQCLSSSCRHEALSLQSRPSCCCEPTE